VPHNLLEEAGIAQSILVRTCERNSLLWNRRWGKNIQTLCNLLQTRFRWVV